MPSTPSPLRYPGGKTKLYRYVKTIIEANGLLGQTYIEPFAGGAGLALKLLEEGDVKRIVINDFDPAIYAFWNSVLHRPNEMCNFINTVNLSIEEWDNQKEVYDNPERHSEIDLAKAVLFLNRSNVSGVIKGGIIGGRNQSGPFTISARFNRESLCKKITDISQKADHIDLYQLNAIDFLQNDILGHYYKVFINFDPPYVKKGGKLYKNSFTENDHRMLRNHIASCKRKWIVTYDICDLVAQLYHSYRSSYLDVYYSANTVRRAQEYIFFSNNTIVPNEIRLINMSKSPAQQRLD